MSFELYDIGTNLIDTSGINSSLERVIGKITEMQEVSDRVNGELSLSSSAVADLTHSTAGFAASWSLASEAAARMMGAAGSLPAPPAVDGGEGSQALQSSVAKAGEGAAQEAAGALFWGKDALGNFGGAAAMPGGQGNATQFQSQSVRNDDASAMDWAGAFETPRSPGAAIAENGEGNSNASLMQRYAQTVSGETAMAVANAGRPAGALSETGSGSGSEDADDPGAQVSSRTQSGRWDSLAEWHVPSTSSDIEPGEYFGNVSGGMEQDNQKNIRPQDYQTMPNTAGWVSSQMDGGTVAAVLASLLPVHDSAGGFTSSSVGLAPGEKLTDEERAPSQSFGQDFNSGGQIDFALGAERLAQDGSSARVAAETLFQNGQMQRLLAAVGAIPDLSESLADARSKQGNMLDGAANVHESPTQSGAEPIPVTAEHLNALTGELGRLGDWAEVHPGIGSDVAPSVDVDPWNGFGATTAEDAGRGAAFGESSGEGAGGIAAGAPGWLVALTAAVVMEVSSTLHGPAGAGETKAGRQSSTSPSGTRNDPMHVRVIGQSATYQSHMPAGPTASLPSQSLPIPGQVLFSP